MTWVATPPADGRSPPVTSGGPARDRPLRVARVIAALLIVHAGLLVWSATCHSPNVNEPSHLAAGISHWQLGNFELYRVNPPLVQMVAALPALAVGARTDWSHFFAPGDRPEFVVGPDFVSANGERSLWLCTLGRWACIPFSLVGGLTCYLWGRELYGRASGLLSVTLWCFCPNIVGHAACFTPDAHAAAMGFAANYLFWRWLRRPEWGRGVLAGTALGAALLTKSTWIVLLLLWPLLGAIWWCWSPGATGPRHAPLRQWSVQLLAILLLGLYVLNSGYLYNGPFQRLGDFPFISQSLGGQTGGQTGNRFRGTLWGALPVPLPAQFVLGADEQKRDFEIHHPSFLRGKIYEHGFWYYYLYGLAVKVPLGTWSLISAAGISIWKRRPVPGRCRDEFVLLSPLVVVLVLVSAETDYTAHVRYVLPIFPYAFVWIGQLGMLRTTRSGCSRIVVGSLVWSVLSSLSISPHWLSYFNEPSGGPLQGHRHLANSNLDWGQDLLYLRDWLAAHPEAEPIGLAYYGMFHPRAVGIDFQDVPGWLRRTSPAEGAHERNNNGRNTGPRPGWYAVSVNFIVGHPFWEYRADGDRDWFGGPYFTYFRELRPAATMGYSICVYHLTEEDVRRLRGSSPAGPTVQAD